MRRRTLIAMLGTLSAALVGGCGGLWWWLRRDPLGAFRTFMHKDMVYAVAFDDAKQLLASGGEDGLRVWNVPNGEQVDFYTWRVAALEWVNDKLMIAAPDEGIIVLNMSTGRVEEVLGKPGEQMALGASADGKYIAWGIAPVFSEPPDGLTKKDFSIHVWHTATGKCELLQGHTGPVVAIIFDPLDTNRVASTSTDGTLRVWDLVAKAEVAIAGKPMPLREQRTLTSVASHGHIDVSSDGQYLLLGYSVRPFSAPARTRQFMDVSTSLPHASRFSPDNRLIATGHADGTVRLWSFPQLQLLATFPANKNGAPIYAVDFSPDGTLLAAGGMGQIGTFDAWGQGVPMYDRAVRVWKVADLLGR